MNIERLRIYDKCLRSNKKHTAKELMDKINAVRVDKFISSRNTINQDLKYIESKLNGETKLIKERQGYYTVYYYKDKNFSLFKTPLNEDETEKLKLAAAFLSEFKGLPQSRWVEETIDSLTEKNTIKRKEIREVKNIMSFDFEKAERFGEESTKMVFEIYNHIKNEEVLDINYQPFFDKQRKLKLHPYHIRLYNKRWFLLGYDEISQIKEYIAPLDRIVGKIKVLKNLKYIKSRIDSWEEHFEDFVGVTKSEDEEMEIRFKAYGSTWHYINTKPIHSTQRKIKKNNGNTEPVNVDDYGIFSISIIPNNELKSIFKSYGDKIDIISPESFKL